MAGIIQILNSEWPGAKFAIKGGDYSTLEWDEGNAEAKPTLAEITALSATVDAKITAAAPALAAGRALIADPSKIAILVRVLDDLANGETPATADVTALGAIRAVFDGS